MKIKFLTDHIGRETAMKLYFKGDAGEFAFAQAQELIRLGVADFADKINVTADPGVVIKTGWQGEPKPYKKKAGTK